MMTVVVRTGDEALAFISSPAFVNGWEAILQDCTWSTACQYPDFIIPWYQIYQDRCSPVVVSAQDDDGAVTGLLTLALTNGGKRLVGAGMVEAEYQCWVERPENSNQFMRQAVEAIRIAFPKATLHLRYINVGAPVDWIGSLEPGYYYRLHEHARPLMKLSGSEIAARLGNRKIRAKIKKLKQSGALSFERVNDHDAFLASFDEVCAKYDHRQKKKNFVMPFKDDPLKGRFYKELHRRGILHATSLNVGNRIAAFHAGLISRSWLHLGINVQSSDFDAHSPGILHLLMMSALAQKEDFLMLDLTPGGDAYKESFATQHDTVYEFLLFPGYLSYLKNRVAFSTRTWAKSALKRLNIRSSLLRQASARFIR
jgi:CelD/BcsL family acetyltransferase involved in cellulose biosynthesis